MYTYEHTHAHTLIDIYTYTYNHTYPHKLSFIHIYRYIDIDTKSVKRL